MNPVTVLRIIGATILFGVLVFAGTYNIDGPPLLVMTVGFVVAFELLAVRAAKTSPGKGAALAAVTLVALAIVAKMSMPTSALVWPVASHAGSYPECLLENLPGVQNDAAANAAHQVCMSKFQGGMAEVAQGAGGASGDFSSGAECTLRMAANTPSQRAGHLIGAACRKLYDEPSPAQGKPMTIDEFLDSAPRNRP